MSQGMLSVLILVILIAGFYLLLAVQHAMKTPGSGSDDVVVRAPVTLPDLQDDSWASSVCWVLQNRYLVNPPGGGEGEDSDADVACSVTARHPRLV